MPAGYELRTVIGIGKEVRRAVEEADQAVNALLQTLDPSCEVTLTMETFKQDAPSLKGPYVHVVKLLIRHL